MKRPGFEPGETVFNSVPPSGEDSPFFGSRVFIEGDSGFVLSTLGSKLILVGLVRILVLIGIVRLIPILEIGRLIGLGERLILSSRERAYACE